MSAVFELRREYAGRMSILQNGDPVYGPANRDHAERKLEELERAARVKVRPCMTCDTMFRSEGPHNRLCDGCRKRVSNGHDGAV